MNKAAVEDRNYFENWYSNEDPWKSANTISDRIRRAILLNQIGFIFSDGIRKTVLDAGCGEGYISKDVSSKFNVLMDAFDISENALATAQRKNAHENINYFQLDLKDYVPQKKYDLIMCEEALYYLPDDERKGAMKKFYDSIKEGGYLRVTAISIGETQWRKYLTPEAIQNLVIDSGFQIISIVPSGIQKKGYHEKAFYRLLEYMNKAKLVGPSLIEYLASFTLKRPLSKCRAISVLATKP